MRQALRSRKQFSLEDSERLWGALGEQFGVNETRSDVRLRWRRTPRNVLADRAKNSGASITAVLVSLSKGMHCYFSYPNLSTALERRWFSRNNISVLRSCTIRKWSSVCIFG